MRKNLLFLALCIYSGFACAQYVGIGTTTPGSGLEVKGTGLGNQQRITDLASGNSLVLQGGAGMNLKVTGFNYTNWTPQPLYLSVDGANTLMNANGGNVGIRTTSPGSPLTVSAFEYGIEHTDGSVRLNTYINSSGGWIGTRSNHPLLFYTNDGFAQMTLTQAGQLGIGTSAPTGGYLLDVAGPVKATGGSTHFVTHATGGTNSWARLYLRTGPSPNFTQSWFMGTSRDFNGNQLYVADETHGGVIRFAIQPAGGPIYMQGHMTQASGSYGTPKAMIFLNGDGTMIRCFNGLTGSTTGGCGFSSGRIVPPFPDPPIPGAYYVNFPFDLNSRFISVSIENNCCAFGAMTTFDIQSSTQLYISNYAHDGVLTDRPVMIIVY